jgi:GNAT superfamily N-acetyltransferase
MDRAHGTGVREPVDLSRVEVGDPRPDEIEAAVEVVARAMSDSPMTVAVVGGRDPDRCYQLVHRFFTRQYQLASHQRPLVARLEGRVVASTNDLVERGCRLSNAKKLRLVPDLIRARPRTAVRAVRWLDNWERRDPRRPHAHFGPFGVDPPLQGRGIGSLVMHEYTRRLDAAGEASYLETEKPQNVALYSRFGYEVIAEGEVLGVPNWFMWREAGALAPATRDRLA